MLFIGSDHGGLEMKEALVKVSCCPQYTGQGLRHGQR